MHYLDFSYVSCFQTQEIYNYGEQDSENISYAGDPVQQVTEKIKNEIKVLSTKDSQSLLRRVNDESLALLSWSKLADELKKQTPTFWQVLEASAYNPRQLSTNIRKTKDSNIPGIVSAACKLISLHNRDMNAVQRLNSLILLKGGAKKVAFQRLNSTNDCLSYKATLSMADTFGSKWEGDVMKWVDEVDKDVRHERSLLKEINRLEEDAIFIIDPIESVSNLFQTETVKTELQNLQSTMHKGFYFVGDNVDLRTKVRQMTLKNQHKDHHMFQICAYKNRISDNTLDNTKPKDNIQTVEFHNFVPSPTEKQKLAEELSFHVAVQWTENLSCFGPYRAVLPKYIDHQFIKETKRKSERVSYSSL